MFYEPGVQLVMTFTVPDSDGNNVQDLTWSVVSFTKDGTRVTAGAEYSSITFTQDASKEFYKLEFTPASGSTSTYTISAKSDATRADAFELCLVPAKVLVTGFMDAVDAVETGLTLREALRGMVAVLLGKLSGAGTGTVTFRDINDLADRVVADVTTSGNRTSVTLTLS